MFIYQLKLILSTFLRCVEDSEQWWAVFLIYCSILTPKMKNIEEQVDAFSSLNLLRVLVSTAHIVSCGKETWTHCNVSRFNVRNMPASTVKYLAILSILYFHCWSCLCCRSFFHDESLGGGGPGGRWALFNLSQWWVKFCCQKLCPVNQLQCLPSFFFRRF